MAGVAQERQGVREHACQRFDTGEAQGDDQAYPEVALTMGMAC
jgi:hypothetical protein